MPHDGIETLDNQRTLKYKAKTEVESSKRPPFLW